MMSRSRQSLLVLLLHVTTHPFVQQDLAPMEWSLDR
jgi:hypothetical protein